MTLNPGGFLVVATAARLRSRLRKQIATNGMYIWFQNIATAAPAQGTPTYTRGSTCVLVSSRFPPLQLLEVSLLGVGSVLRLERDTWSVVI